MHPKKQVRECFLGKKQSSLKSVSSTFLRNMENYNTKAELIEDMMNFEVSIGSTSKRDFAVELFKGMVSKLRHIDSFKHPLPSFIKRYKLNTAEIFVLLIYTARKMMRGSCGEYSLQAIYIDAKGIVPSDELANIYVDQKSVLLSKGIFSLMGGSLLLRKNLMEDCRLRFKKEKTKTLNPANIIRQLNKYVIGQEDAKEKLTVGICEHLLKCHLNREKGFQFTKNNILISGPSGSGKSFLCQNIAKILNIPFIHADATKYTKTGYYGMDINSCILELAHNMMITNGKLMPSVIFIDEADKLVGYKDKSIAAEGVQEELLRLLESQNITIEMKTGRVMFNFDISNVLFIIGGAFVGLDEIIKKRTGRKNIGFTMSASNDETNEPTAEDFIEYGFMPELVGRIGNFIALNKLTEYELNTILMNPNPI